MYLYYYIFVLCTSTYVRIWLKGTRLTDSNEIIVWKILVSNFFLKKFKTNTQYEIQKLYVWKWSLPQVIIILFWTMSEYKASFLMFWFAILCFSFGIKFYGFWLWSLLNVPQGNNLNLEWNFVCLTVWQWGFSLIKDWHFSKSLII